MKRTLLLCAFLVGLVSSNVMALTLDEARTQGRVGETFYGYLVALKTDAETEKLLMPNVKRAINNWQSRIMCRWMISRNSPGKSS